MADDLGALVTKLVVNIADLKNGLREGQTELKSFQTMAAEVGSQIKSALTFTLGVMGISLALNELRNFAKSSVAAFVEINTAAKGLSVITGSTVSDAAALVGAFKRVGVDTETVTGSLLKMVKQLKTNEQGFNDNKIATRDSSGNLLSMNEILFNSVERLKQLEAGTERNLLATTVFGRSVGSMPGFLKMSQDAVEQYKKQLDSLGITIDDISVAKARQFKEGLRDLDLVFDALKYKVGEALLPSLITIGKAFVAIGPDIAAGLAGIIDTIASMVMAVQVAMVQVRAGIGYTIDWFANLGRSAKEITQAIIFNFDDLPKAIEAAYARMGEASAYWALAAVRDANSVRFSIMNALSASPQKPDRPGIMGLNTALPRTPLAEDKPDDKYVPPAGKGGKGAKETTDNLLAPMLAMYKAKREAELSEAQNSLDLLKTTNEKKKSALAKSLAEGLIDGKAYYQSLQDLQQQETAASLAMIERKKQAQVKAYQESLAEVDADQKLSDEAKSIARQKLEADNRKSLAKLDTEAAQAKLKGEKDVTDELKRQVEVRKQYTQKTEDLTLETNQLLGAITEQEAKLQRLVIDWQRAKQSAIDAGGYTPEFAQAQDANLQAKQFDVRYGPMMNSISGEFSSGVINLINGIRQGTLDIGKTLTDMFNNIMMAVLKPGFDALGNLLTNAIKELVNSAFQSIGGGGFSEGGGMGGIGGVLLEIGEMVAMALEAHGGAYDHGVRLAFAHGGALSDGVSLAFARGGIVTRPTPFRMATGQGLMGEAGPEGILPLTRIGGDLGVKALLPKSGSPAVNVMVNNNAPRAQASAEQQGNGDVIVTIDELVGKAYARRGILFSLINQGDKITRR